MSNLWSINDNSCKTSRGMKRILHSLMVFVGLAVAGQVQETITLVIRYFFKKQSLNA